MAASSSTQEIALKRERTSKEVGLSERRLDTLARLLAARSICTAVMVFNNKLYITANEITSQTVNTHEDISAILEILDHFAKLAQFKKSKNTDSEIFKKILPKERLGKNAIRLSISDDLYSRTIEQTVKREDPILSEMIKNYGENAYVAGMLLGFERLLYDDYLRMTASISVTPVTAVKEKETAEEEKALLKNLVSLLNKKDYEILQEEAPAVIKSQKGRIKDKTIFIHAEA